MKFIKIYEEFWFRKKTNRSEDADPFGEEDWDEEDEQNYKSISGDLTFNELKKKLKKRSKLLNDGSKQSNIGPINMSFWYYIPKVLRGTRYHLSYVNYKEDITYIEYDEYEGFGGFGEKLSKLEFYDKESCVRLLDECGIDTSVID